MRVQVRQAFAQGVQPVRSVHIGRRAHAEVDVDRIGHAGLGHAPQDGEDGRKPRAAGHADDRVGVFTAQVGRAQRAADAHVVPDLEFGRHVGGHASARHQPHMELQRLSRIGDRHGVGPHMPRRELQGRVLARRERERLGQLQADPLDVVRHVLDRDDLRFDDPGRVHDDLVHLRQFDRAVFDQRRLAGQHGLARRGGRVDLGAAGGDDVAREHAAAARSAASRHAAVRDGNLMRAQHFEQVIAGARADDALQRGEGDVHGQCLRAGLSVGVDAS